MAAIVNELNSVSLNIQFLLINSLPQWFWIQNLDKSVSFECHSYKVDVGLIQNGPFEHDLDSTLDQLDLLFNRKENIIELEELMGRHAVEHIISDISPVGLLVGERLKITTTLVENFTWDWIYEIYIKRKTRFSFFITRLRSIYENISLRIQATPFCEFNHNAYQVGPIHRKFKSPESVVKSRLGFKNNENFTIISTGGISTNYSFLSELYKSDENFILCGEFQKLEKNKNLIFLPFNNGIHFPDIIRAANRVVGKVGYGTVVECWAADTPILGICRNDFRESQTLRNFISAEKIGEEIKESEFQSGQWIRKLGSLPTIPSRKTKLMGGNREAALAILNLCNSL